MARFTTGSDIWSLGCTLLELLNNVQASQVSNDFYRAYYLGLLQDVFSVLTDTLHKPGFKLHSQVRR